MQLRPLPPPLQLLHDNTIPENERPAIPRPYPRPPPPRADWTVVRIFKKLYRSDWRTAVIAVAAINSMRFLFAATNAFEHLTPATRSYFPRLARISATLGGLYTASAVIQAFGILSASLKRIWLIRIYTYLSLLGALLVSTAGIVSSLSYFLLGEDLITECIALSLSGSHYTRGLYHAHHLRRSGVPSFRTAYRQCIKAYTHPPNPAPLLPLTLLLFTLLPSILFFLLSYVYYKQTIDPTHPACLIPGIRPVSSSNKRGGSGSGSSTPTHIPHHRNTGASTSVSTPAAVERGERRAAGGKTTNGKGKGKAMLLAPPPTRALRTKRVPSALDLPHESLGLLGNTSADIVASAMVLRSPRGNQPRSPYDISPGPPSFSNRGGSRTGAPGPSRLTGAVGAEVGMLRGAAARSVWFAKATGSGKGSGRSDTSDGCGHSLGYSYADAYGGRLI